MSTEVTPDLLRLVASAWEGSTASDNYARNELRAWADDLEWRQRPTPGQVLVSAGHAINAALSWADLSANEREEAEEIAAAVLAAHGTPTLAEWCCPSCGETTRARMADQDAERTEQ